MQGLTKSRIVPAHGRALFAGTLFLSLSLVSFAASQAIRGAVTNGTTGELVVGDKVTLIELDHMAVVATSWTDRGGKFSFTVKDGAGKSYLIGAVHQGLTYYQPMPPRTNSVDVKVYDVARLVPGVHVVIDVTAFQPENTSLQGVRLFGVNNTSSPPKTQMNDRNFEFYLPQGATITRAQATAPNGQPMAAKVTPLPETDRYAVALPLRPGKTQLRVAFSMPYSGELKIEPKLLAPVEHMIVILPKSMKFKAERSSVFQVMRDPSQKDTIVEVVSQARPGQSLGFTLKGKGTIDATPKMATGGAQQPTSGGQGSKVGAQHPGTSDGRGGQRDARSVRPGPLQQYGWYVLAGFVLVLGARRWYVKKRRVPTAKLPAPATALPNTTTPRVVPPLASTEEPSVAPPEVNDNAGNSPVLLESLKEEMFQLELERWQGKMTQSEYEKAKAELDQALGGALEPQG